MDVSMTFKAFFLDFLKICFNLLVTKNSSSLETKKYEAYNFTTSKAITSTAVNKNNGNLRTESGRIKGID
jgi:hypothetical protein